MTGGGGLGLLLRYARPRKRALGLLGGLLLSAVLLEVATPLVVRGYIDSAYSDAALRVLVVLALSYLGLAMVLQGLRVVATYVGENAAWAMTNEMRADLTQHCLELDFRFHKEHTPGELIERVDGDVSALSRFLSSAFLVIIGNVLLFVGIFVTLFITAWRIGLVLAIYAVCAIGVLFAVRNIATKAWWQVRESSATLFGFVEERLSSTEDIRSSGAEAHVLGRLGGLGQDVLRWQRSARIRGSLIFISMHGLYVLAYGIALAVGAYLYLQGLATIGTVYLVVAYSNAIYTPLNEVRAQIQDLQRAQASVARINDLFATASTVTDGPGVDLPDGALAVEFDRVSFAYADGEAMVLTDVSFAVQPGAVLGVLGRTGSGKTSVARLVARMYDPAAGTVRLGGADARDARVAQIRERVGMVTQEVQLFPGTVRDNLALFDEAIGDDAIATAIARLGLGQWFGRLSDGLETVLDGDGGGMSAGEAQLLGVCRVFLRDPSVVILDEASSRLDRATEALLDTALTELLRGRTGLVIAHRLATLDRTDQIMIMEEGRVVEFGERTALLRDPGSRLAALHDLAGQETPA
jgi:ABC-type multidrug transport system fused ATPase/permease subunit